MTVGALSGIRVLCCSSRIASVLAAALLGDEGAEVVHLRNSELPSRFDLLARGSAAIAIDPANDEQRLKARNLVHTADIVLEATPNGLLSALGLAADSCLLANPRLIYCSIPSFAHDHPLHSLPYSEHVLSAATGCYSARDGSWRATGLSIPSTFGALAAALAVVMALIARERNGVGQRIEIPLYDATFLAIGASGLFIDGVPAGGRPDDAWQGVFRCADGRYVRFNLATPRFVHRFTTAIGPQEWISTEILESDALSLGSPTRARQQQGLRNLIAGRTAAEWEDFGARIVVPMTVIRTRDEWLATEHARSIGASVDLGVRLTLGRALKLDSSPPLTRRPMRHLATTFDWSTRSATGNERRGSEDIRQPLQGLKVIDLSQVLAAPTATRTLAEFGADVVKINNPFEEGAGYRWNVHRYHTDVNRGKATLLLDLKRKEGRDVLWRLIETADVVVQNFRIGVPERLGISYEQLRARRPNLIYGSVSAFGSGGPWEARPGYEPNAQAVSGIAARDGGFGEPGVAPYAVSDYSTGLLGALALGLAIYERRRTGKGQKVEAALARSATVLQASSFVAEQDDLAATTDTVFANHSPFARIYESSSGAFCIDAHDDQQQQVLEIASLAHLDPTDPTVAEQLANAFSNSPVDEIVKSLQQRSIPAHALVPSTALMRDSWVIEHGLAITRTHHGNQQITTIGPPFRLARTPASPGRPAAPPGSDAQEVFDSIGMGDALADLVARRIVLLD